MDFIRSRWIFALVVSGFAAACGGDGGTDVGDEVTEVISAQSGGTVELGAARVEFPPNAFAEDTEVSVRVASLDEFAPLEHARGNVLVFEPSMALSASALIEMDPGQPAPGDSGFALFEQFIDNTWIGVDSSTIVNEDGLVESSIYRLAPTVVVVLPPTSS